MDEWPSDSGLDVLALLGAALGTLLFAWKEKWVRDWRRAARARKADALARDRK